MRTMIVPLLLLCGLCLSLSAGPSAAFDTSPYLVGVWEYKGATCHRIVNPTTNPLDVYAVYMTGDDPACYWRTVQANGRYTFCHSEFDTFNTAKFFAFPQGTRKFNPNAVIGGFQLNWWDWDESGDVRANSRTNMKAVTINSWTIGEFQMLPAKCFEEEPL